MRPSAPTLSHARRIAKATTGFLWRREWHTTPKLGGYAVANRIPPSTSPSKEFVQSPREVFGCLIQCKTNHGYTGEFRRRFFPGEDITCPCGEEVQTREHIITRCPNTRRGKRKATKTVKRPLAPHNPWHQRWHPRSHLVPTEINGLHSLMMLTIRCAPRNKHTMTGVRSKTI